MFDIDSQNNISLTRGDTGIFDVDLVDSEGDPYTPIEGETLRFAMSKKWGAVGDEVLVYKDIPIDTCTCQIDPEDTKPLKFGDYVYDIQFTDIAEHVSTIIKAKFKITEEVC